MTDAVAKELDVHKATDVHIFEVAGETLRDYEEWSGPVQIKFGRDNTGKLWLLVKTV